MKVNGSQTDFTGGIADSLKRGGSHAFSRGIDFRRFPEEYFTSLPKANKESGSVVTDLVKWMERIDTEVWAYGDTGRLYERDSNGSWSFKHGAAESSGNGMAYLAEDDFLYYMQDKAIGRYGPVSGSTPTFYDNYLVSQGGEPTNTKSLDLEASSSQYASVTDNADQSITGDLTIEAYIKPESLPTTGNEMTLVSKWDENGNQRSYRFYIGTVSNFFGDGSDGALTISSNTTDSPIDASCSGTSGTNTLSATNASFAAGQKILIHQTRGTAFAGAYQITKIQSYTTGTITTEDSLDVSYSSTGDAKAQVIVIKQYTNVTVNTGITWTAKAWDGTTGGVLAFLANGTITVNGTITAFKKGFRGGSATTDTANLNGWRAEGVSSAGDLVRTSVKNVNAGGGGGEYTGTTGEAGSGGGGGHATSGGVGGPADSSGEQAQGGSTYGTSSLSTMVFGGGGGGGGTRNLGGGSNSSGKGGTGGGIIGLFGTTVTMGGSGVLTAYGESGSAGTVVGQGSGGGGGGGSILIKCQSATLGSGQIVALGGVGGDDGATSSGVGGDGGDGRIHIDYYTSFTGTTNPSINSAQDDALGNTDGYSLNLDISSNGTNVDSYEKEAEIETGNWYRVATKIDASLSTAEFYVNGSSIGADTGTLTAIYDSTSSFAVGCDFNSSAQNFYDGLIDDVRLWNDLRSDSELLNNKDQKLTASEANLVSYYEFEDNVNDSHSNANNMTATGSPTYSSDVPFVGVTTRLDQDQAGGGNASTYTLGTSINEGATHRQTFVPQKDPQKSISVNIDTVGTGDWTLTVHNGLNEVVAEKTVTNGNLITGIYDFIFDDVWRPVIGATYHFHITSTVADGVVKSTTLNDLEDGEFTTHYQILVEDTNYHPASSFLNFLVIGNGRYVATLEPGPIYNPHRLTLPPGYKVRCFATWMEYVAIGTWKGSSISDYDQGRIFFWDGISTTYNFFIDVAEGGVNAMYGNRGTLYFIAGDDGYLMEYTGGSNAVKVKRVPRMGSKEFIEVGPGAMTFWQSLLHFGVGINGDASSVDRAVYTWGTLDDLEYPKSLNVDYPTSLGIQTGSDAKIGAVYPYGQTLLVSWQNINACGVDEISVDNDPQTETTVEMLLTDLGRISNPRKRPLVGRVDFEPLLSGESVRVKYKKDRGSGWNELPVEDTVGAKDVRIHIGDHFREIQVACDLITSGSTAPKVIGMTVYAEDEQRTRPA